MHQLAFQLKKAPSPSIDNFVVGQNCELVATIDQFLKRDNDVRFLYLWGLADSGKTHLLRAAGAAWESLGRMVCYDMRLTESHTLNDELCICVDDIDQLNADEQIDFFNVYNEIRTCGGKMLVTGRQPLSALNLRADVLTRLGWGLVYQVFPLDDVQKTEALVEYAKLRGFRISKDVIAYVLARYPRDLRSLIALLDGLDRYSMELKRGITIPLVKSFCDVKD
ncbi:DnaA regulatory inactivator Hda [Burkholderiales bacterium]|nr:DnaA regulatory inactivator Hda [Burkholderiales bacterium]